jgi:hypothetical protein
MYELFEGSSILAQKGELIGIICREMLHFRWSWRMCKVKMLGVGLGIKIGLFVAYWQTKDQGFE